jgi:hypothetical protein
MRAEFVKDEVQGLVFLMSDQEIEELFFFRDVAQPGSALRSGRRGRWFESSHLDLSGRQ